MESGIGEATDFALASVVKKLSADYIQEGKNVIQMKKVLLKGLSMLLSYTQETFQSCGKRTPEKYQGEP